MAEADLVCYWFEKAERPANRLGQGDRGPSASSRTNSIRGHAQPASSCRIGHPTAGTNLMRLGADEPWVVDGAAVRVSLVCFCRQADAANAVVANSAGRRRAVDEVYADLTARRGDAGLDLSRGWTSTGERWCRLSWATSKGGPFDMHRRPGARVAAATSQSERTEQTPTC